MIPTLFSSKGASLHAECAPKLTWLPHSICPLEYHLQHCHSSTLSTTKSFYRELHSDNHCPQPSIAQPSKPKPPWDPKRCKFDRNTILFPKKKKKSQENSIVVHYTLKSWRRVPTVAEVATAVAVAATAAAAVVAVGGRGNREEGGRREGESGATLNAPVW